LSVESGLDAVEEGGKLALDDGVEEDCANLRSRKAMASSSGGA
jgi:hypothetical protein